MASLPFLSPPLLSPPLLGRGVRGDGASPLWSQPAAWSLSRTPRSAATRSRAALRDDAHIWSRNCRRPASPSGRARYRRRGATLRSDKRPAFLSTVRCWLTAGVGPENPAAIYPAASSEPA